MYTVHLCLVLESAWSTSYQCWLNFFASSHGWGAMLASENYSPCAITWRCLRDLTFSRLIQYRRVTDRHTDSRRRLIPVARRMGTNTRFEPPFEDLDVTHRVYLWLNGRRIVDFLLVINNWTFSLALTAEALLSDICQNRRLWRVAGSLWVQITFKSTNHLSPKRVAQNENVYSSVAFHYFVTGNNKL